MYQMTMQKSTLLHVFLFHELLRSIWKCWNKVPMLSRSEKVNESHLQYQMAKGLVQLRIGFGDLGLEKCSHCAILIKLGV